VDLKTQWDVLATWIRSHVNQERGASLVEYALLVALIAVVCIAAVSLLGSSASTKFSALGSAISGSGS
jgi:pilus assembly protein Flp/PilA